LLLGLLFGGAPALRAQQDTNGWLLTGCRSQLENGGQSDPVQARACVGGIRSLVVIGAARREICSPGGASPAQVEADAVAIVVRYFDTHPIKPDEMAGPVAYEALKAEWACR
jgi:hypothetical protein